MHGRCADSAAELATPLTGMHACMHVCMHVCMQDDDEGVEPYMLVPGSSADASEHKAPSLANVLDLAKGLNRALAGCVGKMQAIHAAAEAARTAADECSTGGSTLTELVQDATALRDVWLVYIQAGQATHDFWAAERAALQASAVLAQRARAMCGAVRDAQAAADVTSAAAQVGAAAAIKAEHSTQREREGGLPGQEGLVGPRACVCLCMPHIRNMPPNDLIRRTDITAACSMHAKMITAHPSIHDV